MRHGWVRCWLALSAFPIEFLPLQRSEPNKPPSWLLKPVAIKKPFNGRLFYEGNSADLIAALQQLPDTVERVMLIGHNPILEETVATLCTPHSPDVDDGWTDGWAIKIPTAGLVCLDFEIMDLGELRPGDGMLRWFVIPKLVKALE